MRRLFLYDPLDVVLAIDFCDRVDSFIVRNIYDLDVGEKALQCADALRSLARSLECGRPVWPAQVYLSDPDRFEELADFGRCEAERLFEQGRVCRGGFERLLALLDSLLPACQAREAAGWHRPGAWG